MIVMLVPSPTPEMFKTAFPPSIGAVNSFAPTTIVILPVASLGTITVTLVLLSKTEVLSIFGLISIFDTLNVAFPILFKYLASPL